MIKEYFKIAIKNLRTRQLRSWLTILGIVIGVFLIMSLLSLSQGLKTSVMNQMRGFGTDIVMIMPGSLSDIMTTMIGGMKIETGRWPSPGKREVVVGSLVPTDVFPGLRINNTATIKGRQFEVVGV